MSNPGVITLASLQNTEYVDSSFRFDIEDNIGEAIHLHYRNFRIDLSVAEFLDLSEQMYQLIDNVVGVDGFRAADYDPQNLLGLARLLVDLKEVEETELHLEDILVDTYDADGRQLLLPLPNSRVVRALEGDTQENNAYTVQLNPLRPGGVERISNQERVDEVAALVERRGYPIGDERIVLRADNAVIDGQHRAAALYKLRGNISVPVRRLHFKENQPTAPEGTLVGVGSIYFDLGDGFSEHSRLGFEARAVEGFVHVSTSLPAGTRGIRFDPLEGSSCVVRQASFDVDGVELTITMSNGIVDEDLLVFPTIDPQLIFDTLDGEGATFSATLKLDVIDSAFARVMANNARTIEELTRAAATDESV